MANYTVGINVPFVFDTAPNITGLTDVVMRGVDLGSDANMTLSGGLLIDTSNGGGVFTGVESTTSPGTYVANINTLPIGNYLLWMYSTVGGFTSPKVLVTVTPLSGGGDPFFGNALA